MEDKPIKFLPSKTSNSAGGKLVGNTTVVTVHTLKGSVHCCGGIQVEISANSTHHQMVIPLFYQLYQQEQLNASLVNCLINLIGDLLHGHKGISCGL